MKRTFDPRLMPKSGVRAMPAAGVVLAGKYELVEEIARSATGAVWEAERVDWRSPYPYPVAIKILTVSTSNARVRFELEICLTALFRSQRVAQLLDSGIDEGTRTRFLVMELLDGENLAHRLNRLKRLSPKEVLVLVTQVGGALSRAHKAGFVHDRVTPDNIYLVADGDEPSFKLLDFRHAKAFKAGAMARLRYKSSEQPAGQHRRDQCGDLWSLAVIACECLTGRRPFDVVRVPALAALRWGRRVPPPPSSFAAVPAGFDEWFARATWRDDDRRFTSVQELSDALRAICSENLDQPLPPIVCEYRWRRCPQPSTMPGSHLQGLRQRLFLQPHAKVAIGFCIGLLLGVAVGIYLLAHPRGPAKRVTAIGGDHVCVRDHQLVVNGNVAVGFAPPAKLWALLSAAAHRQRLL